MINKFFIGIFSVILVFLSGSAMADLVLSEGGATGTWFNAGRSGEGFYVEIIRSSSGANSVSIAMYSFDGDGDPLWLVGTGGISTTDTTANFTVYEYDGPMWGPGFDSGDLNETAFGTINVRFPTCDTALFSITSNGTLPSYDYSLIRLTYIEGLTCVPPTEPSPPGLASGGWLGMDGDVCFNVSEDGTQLYGGNASICDVQSTFDSNLDGTDNKGGHCSASVACEGTPPIENGEFRCTNETGALAIGIFTSNNTATGTVYEPLPGEGDYCTATWTASPAN